MFSVHRYRETGRTVAIIILRFEEDGGILFLLCPSVPSSIRHSVRPSVTSIFRCTFLSNHASQQLQTWYGASARSPTFCLLNSHPPVIYFLFYDLVFFSRHKSLFSDKPWSSAKLSSHFSQQP